MCTADDQARDACEADDDKRLRQVLAPGRRNHREYDGAGDTGSRPERARLVALLAQVGAARDAAAVISVVVADDQELVRAGFRMILDAAPDMEVVAEAEDGRHAVELAGTLRPDVALMDIRMPTVDGIEATRRLVESGCPTKVLILTTLDLDEYVYRAMRAGASGFLLKTVPAAQLVHAIRVVADGGTLLAAAITRRLVEAFVRRPPPGQAVPRRGGGAHRPRAGRATAGRDRFVQR